MGDLPFCGIHDKPWGQPARFQGGKAGPIKRAQALNARQAQVVLLKPAGEGVCLAAAAAHVPDRLVDLCMTIHSKGPQGKET
jgi:hypothetical protein